MAQAGLTDATFSKEEQASLYKNHLGTYSHFVRGVWIMAGIIAAIIVLLAFLTL